MLTLWVGPSRVFAGQTVEGPRHDATTAPPVYSGTIGASETPAVRLRRADAERLRALAAARGTSVADVVHEAIRALEKQEFSHDLAADYARLRADPELGTQDLAEHKEWDALP